MSAQPVSSLTLPYLDQPPVTLQGQAAGLSTLQSTPCAFLTMPPAGSSPSLVHPDPCYSPLGLARLPEGSLPASSQQLERPTWAAILRPALGVPGWSPVEHADTQEHTPPPYLQLDLLQPRNLTGQWGDGRGQGWRRKGWRMAGLGVALTALALPPAPPPRHHSAGGWVLRLAPGQQ